MNEDEQQRLINELKDLYKKLKSYMRYLRSENLSENQKRYMESLREGLVRKSSVLKAKIFELSGKLYYTQFGQTHEIWADGLSPSGYLPSKLTGLGFCIDATNEAIGRLESTIMTKKSLENLINYQDKVSGEDFELIVQGTPDMLLTLLTNVTKELNSQGFKFIFERTSGRPDDTNWDKTYFASFAISMGTERLVGNISFQLIPNNRTLLKSTHPKNWNPYFQQFMDYFLAELQRLEFTEFQKEQLTQPLESLPKAFISHGKAGEALNKLQQFLSTLGIEPIIVEDQPSLGKNVDNKVTYYLDQADFVVILATGDDLIEDKLHPRQNVIHEIGLAQNKRNDRIIYLLEEGAQFPSNINPKVWERFKQENMENVFLRINIELRAFGIMRPVKL